MKIRDLHAQGYSIREISRQTGLSRNTIKKYLRTDPVRRRRTPRPSKLDPFKAYLDNQVARGVTNGTRLFHEIRQQGYTGGYTLVKNYLHPRRPARIPPAVRRFDTEPGQQAQVDFGFFGYDDVAGRPQKLWLFVMVLSHSRMTYAEFGTTADGTAVIRGLVHAFQYFGGRPRDVLFDNMKPVVQGRNENGDVVWTPRFLDAALALGFQPRACRPYRAQTKGRVERTIGYIRHHFWPGRTFTDLADLNRQLLQWLDTVANVRPHGTTHERPIDRLATEPLEPLPDPARWAQYLLETRTVSRDGFVAYGGSRYGVPWTVAGHPVTVEDLGERLRFRVDGVLVAEHLRAPVPGSVYRLPHQWDALPLTGPTPTCPGRAQQIPDPDVEVRDLHEYARFGGTIQ